MRERRKFVRLREDDEISFSLIPETRKAQELSRDLSMGGIRFLSGKFLPLHAEMKLEIKLASANKTISGIAKIAWVKTIFDNERFEIGAQFIKVNEEDYKFLEKYLIRTIR